MKYFLIIFIFCNSCANAQHEDHAVKLAHYVFNEFSEGTVKVKSGEMYKQLLNYNILTNEMIFNNNGRYLAIASPDSVDTIYINDRKFIPLNGKFYEVLVASNRPLLLEFTASISEPGTSTGYGGTSNTTASTSYNSLISTGGAYELKLPDGFSVLPGYKYWIRSDGKLEKTGSSKQLIKIFTDKKDVINNWVEKNHPNFSKRDDIIQLVKAIE